MPTLEELQRSLVSASVFPDKRFSQNFLLDDAVIEALVGSAKLSPKDRVMEIGGGTGIVTRAIAATGAHVSCIEFHDHLAPFLKKQFANEKNVEIIEGDVLRTDFPALNFTKVVASPPYAISDDIMYKILFHGFDRAALVWQLEFAEKMLAPPGSSEYHPLSVIVQYEYDANILRKISPKAFYPIPNHFSAILTLERRKKVAPIPKFPVFVEWLRTLFRFKNKTLSNACKQLAKNPVKGVDPEAFARVVREDDWSEEKVFLLEPEEFVELFESFNSEES